jgi:hypothetical protein
LEIEMSEVTENQEPSKKPRKRRSDSRVECYKEMSDKTGLSPKTLRNDVSRSKSLEAAVGGDDFIREHLFRSKLKDRRSHEAIIRLGQEYSVAAVREFILEHKDTGFPDWLTAKPDTTMGQILRLLKKTTIAEREALESVIVRMRNQGHEAEQARKASPTSEATGD